MHPALRSRHRTKSDAGCSVKMRDCCSEEVKLGLDKGLDQMTNEDWAWGQSMVKDQLRLNTYGDTGGVPWQ